MSGHDRTHQALEVLARPGAYEVLHAMLVHDGAATFAQIAAEVTRPLPLLRALSAEGFVVAHKCGTLDIEPCGDTHFCLTARGEAVAGHLMRLQQWAAERRAARGKSRRST